MRRVIAVFVIAVLGAGAFGLSGASSGVRVGATRVSASALRSELSAISMSPTLTCYLETFGSTSFGSGAGGGTFGASGAAAWASLRVEGLAIVQYVQRRFGFRATPSRLAVARSSLEGELTQAAAGRCTGTSAQALAAMPAEMLAAQLKAQAASLYLVSRLDTTIKLSAASLRTYYTSHLSAYDQLCVSVAVVAPSRVSAFRADQQSGLSVTQLVSKYSLDTPSKAKGGALGCYSPGQSAYPAVRSDIGATPLDTFPVTPRSFTASNGQTYALYVAVTRRTVTAFTQAASQVYADVQSLNANAAGLVKQRILAHTKVAVDPAFGRWGYSSSGPAVFVPATPPNPDVTGASVLAGTSGATYK
ncbi:MAG TPA: hypothetical protein VND83_04550 [Acidimicrobiales bacterium]|nr:hypothetical protein [Acidimicrobiales bacterium]